MNFLSWAFFSPLLCSSWRLRGTIGRWNIALGLLASYARGWLMGRYNGGTQPNASKKDPNIQKGQTAAVTFILETMVISSSIPMKPFPYQPTSPIHKFDYVYDTPSLVSRTIGHRPDKKVAQPQAKVCMYSTPSGTRTCSICSRCTAVSTLQ